MVWQCWTSVVSVVAAAAVQRAMALHMEMPGGGPPAAARALAPSGGARRSGSNETVTSWTLGPTGESCVDVCGGWCNEFMLEKVDTEEEVVEIAAAIGAPCDTSLPFLYTPYPVFYPADRSCGYPRSFPDRPICDLKPEYPLYRMCYCSARFTSTNWYRSKDPTYSCEEVCAEANGICNEEMTKSMNSPGSVRGAVERIGGMPCDESQPYLAMEYASQTVSGQCAYAFKYTTSPTDASLVALPSARVSCAEDPDPNLRRMCPCAALAAGPSEVDDPAPDGTGDDTGDPDTPVVGPLDSGSGGVFWELAEGGASCIDVCLGWCNEPMLAEIDSEDEVVAIAALAGNPCNTLLPFMFTPFPTIDTRDGACGYPRVFPDRPICDLAPDPPVFRLCFCSARYTSTQWYISNDPTFSCEEVCADANGICDEGMTRGLNSPSVVGDMMRQLGRPCDASQPYLAMEFAFVTETGQCAYAYVTEGNSLSTAASLIAAPSAKVGSCSEAAPSSEMRRLCPCQEVNAAPETSSVDDRNRPDEIDDDQATAYGDPHLVTLQGEKFDINNAGLSTFLLFPRYMTDKPPRLRVDAKVAHGGDSPKCRGWFITEMWVSGTAVGEGISLSTHGKVPDGNSSLVVQVGEKAVNNAEKVARAAATAPYKMELEDWRANATAAHVHNRVRFAQLTIVMEGAALVFAWSTGKKRQNSMNFKAAHMSAIGTDWGGILGGDDHTWVSQPQSGCERSGWSQQLPQFHRRPVLVVGEASLE